MLLWEYCWLIFCSWTPKPLHPWRRWWLRLFGARVDDQVFVHQRTRINIPWHLTLRGNACIGDRVNLYTLGEIEVMPGAIIAQESYLCTGTHDLSLPAKPLRVAKITIGKDAFIGLRAIILPGVSIGPHAVIGAGAVVTRDVPEAAKVAGNPAKPLEYRQANAQ